MTWLKGLMLLHGVGVGGGSLVYANTLMTPKEEIFQTSIWSLWRRALQNGGGDIPCSFPIAQESTRIFFECPWRGSGEDSVWIFPSLTKPHCFSQNSAWCEIVPGAK